jgi:hypothetical protein
MSNFSYCGIALICCLLGACGAGSDVAAPPAATTPSEPVTNTPAPIETGLAIPDNRYVDSYQVLLFGNSHVRTNNLPAMIALLLQQGTGKEATAIASAGAQYLDERLTDGVSLTTLQSDNWSHVIWQAQKYSTTGQYLYSTSAAEYWLAQTKQQQATPILFPEHPREGNTKEGMRVYLLHKGIASQEAACVAPVGPAWDNAIAAMPQLAFHSDGNHASLNGSFLTAVLFYHIISGEPVEALPYIAQINIAEPQQMALKQLAAATFQQYTACQY